MTSPATRVLGIETSCDETAAAVVEDGRRVRSSVVATQHDLHEPYGGVVPEIASRAHLERLTPTVAAALDRAGLAGRDLDAIAVGNRPGLIGSLVVGVAAAQALAWSLGKPLLGVDHVAAHLVAARLHDGDEPQAAANTDNAALGLVVSGGHTSLYAVDAPWLTRLGHTIDDAVGEAFDKAAVILGLGYPGGPAIEHEAEGGDPAAIDLPRSMLGPGSLDFSFSGLKTALLYTVRGKPTKPHKQGEAAFTRDASDLSPQRRRDLAASFQAAAVDAVVKKVDRALSQLADRGTPAGAVVAGGGVTANGELRRQLQHLADARGVPLHLPAPAYCVDNAAMIAAAGHDRLARGEADDLALPALSTAQA